MNSLSGGNTLIKVKVPIVNRALSGLMWWDYNENGLRDDSESKVSEFKVQLFRLKDEGDAENVDDYEAVTYDGTNEQVEVPLGWQISAKSKSENDKEKYEEGGYRFTDLQDGIYLVKFISLDADEKIKVTTLNVGDDDSIDSDVCIYSDGEIEYMYISNINLPTVDEMNSKNQLFFESFHNDAGIYYNGGLNELPSTGGSGKIMFYVIGVSIILFSLFIVKKYHD